MGCFVVIYFLAYLGLVITVGFVAIFAYSDEVDAVEQSVEQLAGLYDLSRDWQKSPFTEVKVTDKYYCEDGWEPAFERTFYGTSIACDCLGIYGRDMTDENEFINHM